MTAGENRGKAWGYWAESVAVAVAVSVGDNLLGGLRGCSLKLEKKLGSA